MDRARVTEEDQSSGERAAETPAARVPMPGEPLSPATTLALQRLAGNRAVTRLARSAARRHVQRAPADTSPPPGLDEDALPAYMPQGGPVAEDALPVDQAAAPTLQRAAKASRVRAQLHRRTYPQRLARRSSATPAGRVLARYVAADAVKYAKDWALKTNASYPRFVNDCTNFVSQCLLAGGWKMIGGSCSDRKSDSAWWYGDWNCVLPGVRATYTWSGAQNLFNFMTASGRGAALPRISDLQEGDVLQMAFQADDPTERYNIGRVGHSMMVTGKHDGNIFLSYHTDDHLDEPFWGPGGILERHPTAKYYAWAIA